MPLMAKPTLTADFAYILSNPGHLPWLHVGIVSA